MANEPNALSSESLKELAAALSRAQGAMSCAKKDSKNPHFQSSYADLASIREASREAFAANGLSVAQVLTRDGAGGPCLRTLLMHASGEWLASDFPLLGDLSRPQVLGSLLTYARRYSLAAIAGIAQDDDDGHAAQQHAEQRRPARQAAPDRRESRPDPPATPPQPYPEWLRDYCSVINDRWVSEIADVPASVKAPAEIISTFQLNRHLLKALTITTEKSEAANLTAGSRAWQGNREAMQAEGRAYCRKLWKDAKAKLTPPREPGSDDNMPSPDEDAVLDRLASGKAVAGA